MGKKNGSYGKVYGKVVGKDASDRPGWKGPSYVPKKKAIPKEKPAKEPIEEEANPVENLGSKIPQDLQQLLLNIFRDSFSEVIDSDERTRLLQEVKNALYERDFHRAFGKREFLEAYSVRWSPSRALCYAGVLVDVSEFLREIFPLCGVLGESESEDESEDEEGEIGGDVKKEGEGLRAVCFGGGAAEVVAFGGFMKVLLESESGVKDGEKIEDEMGILSISETGESSKNPDFETIPEDPETTTSSGASPKLDLVLVDNAHWGEVIHTLKESLIKPPPISKYSTAAAKAANTSLLTANDITTTFLAEDVLSMTVPRMSSLIGTSPMLITLLFTLNELYTFSISQTTKFLLNLTMTIKVGSLLLVVDSPGSYSETTVNGSAKKYPMHWLLDHTLLDTAKVAGRPAWEKVVSDDSRWFRVPEELRYPISIENMRYQIHLYRRL